MPKATIVMATHNPDPRLLRRQVESLRAQTVPDWRALVFDDASRDSGVVREILAGDGRFELLPPRAHLGHYAAFEHVLDAAADGDRPVFFCDQDDFWHPDNLGVLLPVLEAGADAVFSGMRVVDASGGLVRERFLSREPDEVALRPASLLLMNCVSGASLAVSPRTVRAALPFPAPDARGWHDQWLAAVAARLGKLEFVAEPLVDYTQHAGQVMGDGLRALDAPRLRAFGRRTGSLGGVGRDLRSRTRWITAAATRLLALPGDTDPDLAALAQGHWNRPLAAALWRGWRRGDVPASRAALLAAGFPLTSSATQVG